MELAVALLSIALVAALGALLLLWRRVQQPPSPPPPPPDPISPLFYATAAAVDAGLVLLDDDRHVIYLNPQAEQLLGVDQRTFTGQGLIGLVRDYHLDTLVSEVLRDGEAREVVHQPLNQNRTLRVRATALAGSGFPGALLLMRDVTQLSMLERARRDLVANVSHELRTPIASIKLLVETVQSSPPAPVAARMLGQMAHEVDAVAQLVDELHELSQIESGRVALQFAPTSLAAVIARAVERIRARDHGGE